MYLRYLGTNYPTLVQKSERILLLPPGSSVFFLGSCAIFFNSVGGSDCCHVPHAITARTPQPDLAEIMWTVWSCSVLLLVCSLVLLPCSTTCSARDGPSPLAGPGGENAAGDGAPVIGRRSAAAAATATAAAQDARYFEAYSQLEHQAMMLRDRRRMDAYRAAILGQPDVFRGKVVLDVGCGTGVLSLWAAQAGARRVHAVEAR